MAEMVQIVAQERKETGTSAMRRLRRKGQVPAVVYGHKEATVSVSLVGEELHKVVRRGVRVVDLDVAGKKEKALIRDVQWDALGHAILHVDFARVAETDRVVVDVKLELRGIAPGIAAGGLLDQPLHNLSLECPALAVPDSVRVNISNLQLGQAIHVKDLPLPPGVVAKNDPEAIVVHVVQPAAEPEAGAVPGAAEQAEPEVIIKGKGEEKEEAE